MGKIATILIMIMLAKMEHKPRILQIGLTEIGKHLPREILFISHLTKIKINQLATLKFCIVLIEVQPKLCFKPLSTKLIITPLFNIPFNIFSMVMHPLRAMCFMQRTAISQENCLQLLARSSIRTHKLPHILVLKIWTSFGITQL